MKLDQEVYDKINKDIPNQEFLNSLAKLNELKLHDEPAAEVWKIMQTFTSTCKKNGPDSFNAMYILFDSDYEPLLVLEPRPYTSKEDMYTCFSEMMFSYQATNSPSFILANDTRLRDFKTNEVIKESLMINFVSEESASVVILPYSIDEDNDITWMFEDFNLTPIEADPSDESTAMGPMVELFFTMSHAKYSPFDLTTLVNYYNFRDFPLMISPDAVTDKIKLEF
jgi:hypothetical protein